MKFYLGLIVTLILGGWAAGSLYSSQGNWALSYDAQAGGRCLPFTFYFVDKDDSSYSYGDIVVLPADEVGFKYLPKGRDIAKLVVGLPGDTYSIKDNAIYINHQYWGDLNLLLALDDIEVIQPFERTLSENEILALGTEPLSVDGRYFGPIKKEWITGKAYAIF